MSGDPYIDPDTGVLRNLLGISDPTALAYAEAEITALRLASLAERPLPGDYDLDHLRAFHRFIFGDIYPWAGEIRTVSIAKGQPFCLPQHIDAFAADVFHTLARRDHLRGLERSGFIAGLTDLIGHINALHPFRDGNGRTQRAFCSQLADQAGYRIAWERMDSTANVSASRAALAGDNVPMRALLDRIVEPTPHTISPPDPREPPLDHRGS